MFFPTLPAMNKQAVDAAPVQKMDSAEEKEGAKPEETEEPKENFSFPDGGWECNKCQNYNFKGRKACFRCKKTKCSEDNEGKPEHMTKQKRGGRRRNEEVNNENC